MTKRRKTRREETEGSKREEEALKIISELVDEEVGDGGSFAEYEETLLRITNELARRQLERKLQSVAHGHAPVLRIHHNQDWHGWREEEPRTYRRHLPGAVTYHSLVGPLRVRRCTYRENHRNGATYVPLELDAGLMERMTPGLAKCAALGHAHLPTRQTEALLRAAGRCPPSRSTLDRCARDLGAYALAANDEIEPAVRAEESVPAQAVTLVLGLDRTSVLMRNTGRSSGFLWTRGIRESRPQRHLNGEKAFEGVQWKLDYVGTVSFVDREGKRVVSREYRLPSEASADEVVERMLADVTHALNHRPDLRLAIVQDGAPELWNALRRELRKLPGGRPWHEILDWYHVDERLSRCLDLACAESTRRSTRARWHAALLETPNGAERVIRSLRRAATDLPSASRDELREHITYFAKRRDLMRYARARDAGLPIGSGVTEGACKSLVGTRAKRSGQHWTQRGLSSTLHLRAIDQSDRFERYWPRFTQRYRATSILPLHS